jgi:hypothetical protein
MPKELAIAKHDFLKLTAGEICKIVTQKKKPRVGVFLSDGNRRLVMMKTGLAPNTDQFYQEYARIFLSNFRNALEIFFNHGLNTLFSPILGPSLLERKNKFHELAIPIVFKALFLSEDWHMFYRKNGIKIKVYGNLDQLKKVDPTGLNMTEGIDSAIRKTASHEEHTLFLGFVSSNTIDNEMTRQIIEFYKSHQREPDYREIVEAYYGEFIEHADFFISSTKIAGINALPPLLSSNQTRMYYLIAPFFLAFNDETFRNILYDLIFLQPDKPIAEYDNDDFRSIEKLTEFYQLHQNTVIGTGKRIGRIWVPDI